MNQLYNDPYDRCQKNHQNPYGIGKAERKTVGILFGCNFGDRLTADDHENSHYRGRRPGILLPGFRAEQEHQQNRREGRARNVHQVVPDENGAQRIIKMIQNITGSLCRSGTFFQIFQPQSTAGRIRHFRSREKG